MILPLLVLAQTVVPIEPSPPPATTRVVLPGAGRERCPVAGQTDEIVVCGSADHDEQLRLRPLPEKYVDRREARVALPGNTSVRAHAAQGRLGDAQAVITFTVPF